MTVKERLIKFIKHKNISVRKFESLCGLSFGYIHNMRVSIQPDKMMNIAAQFPELNSGWILTGEGDMLKEPGTAESLISYIRLLPISAIGGSLNNFVVAVKDNECEKIISPVKEADFAITEFRFLCIVSDFNCK